MSRCIVEANGKIAGNVSHGILTTCTNQTPPSSKITFTFREIGNLPRGKLRAALDESVIDIQHKNILAIPVAYCIAPGLSAPPLSARTERGCLYSADGRRAIPSIASTMTALPINFEPGLR